MVLLQNRLNLKVSQKQILTPGLVQMVTVLALNKLELKDMITAEMVENPVLEELESQIPTIDEIGAKEEQRERADAADEKVTEGDKADPFDEIDFGSFFRDYLDPGHRTHADIESLERPSFENFLSSPTTLTDHLMWQLGSMAVGPDVCEAAERIIGNLDESGYLLASEEELMGLMEFSGGAVSPDTIPGPAPADFIQALIGEPEVGESPDLQEFEETPEERLAATLEEEMELAKQEAAAATIYNPTSLHLVSRSDAKSAEAQPDLLERRKHPKMRVLNRETVREALALVQSMDPIGVAARDVRECLLLQLNYHKQLHENKKRSSETNGNGVVIDDCIAIISNALRALQTKQFKEIAKAVCRPVEAVMAAFEFIKTLDPRPGHRYNQSETRLIEPDVAFVKHGDEWLVMMNEDDVPVLRLNPAYKKLMNKDAAEKDVRNYVKERYKSAIQLIKNIEQRKQTILKVCYSIIERQHDFLEYGIDRLKPMMIKEVAEEIGVHPSTVSRAVSSKYVHTPQGVFELRYFFSESVNGPEGGGTSLLILKRRVKKLIEEEDSARPLTDEQLTKILQSQGIQVTRRTVAKYREDMNIPSTHQRRVKE
ncbi:MAG TPA: RNA polymerase factor sigma-54 [Terriglobales bacterium]|nr:RNA polymerase factor sigma-54 [Terriglobales bacterium]